MYAQVKNDGIKFIHWDSFSSEKTEDFKFKFQPTINPNLRIVNGIEFSWRIVTELTSGNMLHCLARDVYLSNEMKSLNSDNIKEIMLLACNYFADRFDSKCMENSISLAYSLKIKIEDNAHLELYESIQSLQ